MTALDELQSIFGFTPHVQTIKTRDAEEFAQKVFNALVAQAIRIDKLERR